MPNVKLNVIPNEMPNVMPDEPLKCKQCLLRDMQGKEADYYQSVLKYRKTLDVNHGVEDLIYEERLSACTKCDALVNGVCKHCGCFVEMRAALQKNKCPNPGKNLWHL